MPASAVDGPAVTFTVNDEKQQVLRRATSDAGLPTDVSGTTTLADYLRVYRQLPGTKTMCREGMCGACVVSVTSQNPATGKMESRAVNSCMVPIKACEGWQIETVEGIGDRKKGYHPVQARLAHMNGTQCGYCTPGMVMSMYSALKAGGDISAEHVEQTMDGNLCRCTGYRPILEAFKTFGSDVDEKTRQAVKDIEETAGCHGSGSGGQCRPTTACVGCPRASSMTSATDDWKLPDSLQKAMSDLSTMSVGNKTVRLVAGNTSMGVLDKYEDPSDGYISLLKVPELRVIKRPTETKKLTKCCADPAGATFGAAVTLSELIRELQSLSSTAGYRHFAAMAKHLLVVANTPVRNAATWAGNLMIKYKHRDFPSDVFLLLVAAGAKLKVAEGRKMEEMSVEKLYEISMKNKIIVSMTLPPIDENKYIFKSYKITPRAISAHAYVNAAFVIPYDSASGKITDRPTVLFGGISDKFVHASQTERYLTGRALMDESTLRGALTTVLDEVNPEHDPEHADVAYRKKLACNLLYKAILHVLGDKAPARLRSGGEDLIRGLSSGSQEFDTDKTLWPVNKAVPKYEAQVQTSGEAEYVDDQPALADELHGFYVLTTVATGTIRSINTAKALAVPGVRGFVSAEDIIGKNEFYSMGLFFPLTGIDPSKLLPEKVFVKEKVQFCGQPIGLVVADSKAIARRAAALVHVEYDDVTRPVLTIKDALKTQPEGLKQSTLMPVQINTGDAEGALKTATHRVSGEWEMGGQYHFTMETQSVRVVPAEDGQLNMFCATQGIRDVVDVVAGVTNVPSNKINGEVRRIGGGYGGKIINPMPIAGAAATAALKFNRPVRIVLDIEANIEMNSDRIPFLINYDVGFADNGKIEALKMHIVGDTGYSFNVTSFFELMECMHMLPNVYHTDNWAVTMGNVYTNQQLASSTRAPGSTNAIAIVEMLMNRVAHELGMDPWEVRRANLASAEGLIPKELNSPHDQKVFSMMVKEMFSSGEINARKAEIAAFNKANRWTKRSLSLVPMQYPVSLSFKMAALVSIHDRDGSVAVSHAGVEMGQGMNTKVAQTVAYELGVPLETVSVKPTNNLINPNGLCTGGSIGSELNCFAARLACQELLTRLKPFRAPEGEPERPWLVTVQMASGANVNLTAHSMQPGNPEAKYAVWGLTAAEVELDVLTGEYCVRRVDLYEDVGKSLSPWVDIGQLEGAFAMGMGLCLTEQFRLHPDTGKRITNRAWNYWPPTHKDMPRDYRVKMLKNNKNEHGIYNSKATGEPAVCMGGISCLLAIQQAVGEARKDAGLKDWFKLNSPGTVEYAQMACETTTQQLTLA